jgi:hypothetical protein
VGSEHDDGSVLELPLFAHAVKDPKPIEARHGDVEKDEIRSFLADELEGFFTVVGGENGVPVFFKPVSQLADDPRVIIRNHDLGHGFASLRGKLPG